ncbi:MAG: hypothetical protein MZV63_58435 [Marinilabiliales bacterium]|nr:hypothetical protein [Marinilabiliales bacterium]
MLTTVVSGPHGRQVTVDAGLKALYRDGGHPRVLNPEYANLQYDWFGDEYGKLSARSRGTLLPGARGGPGAGGLALRPHREPVRPLFT